MSSKYLSFFIPYRLVVKGFVNLELLDTLVNTIFQRLPKPTVVIKHTAP